VAAPDAPVAGIIESKLRPLILPDSVAPRPRVEQRLRELVERKQLVVVCAAAGSGKTTAVAGACAGLGRPVAWLTIDRSETAPGRLLTYMEAALARSVAQAEDVVRPALSAGVSHPEAAGLLAESLTDTRAVLVLDDVERLGRAADAWRTVEVFLRYLPPDATAVLLSRREIPTDLFRHPGHHAIGLLDDRTLAFTIDEAAVALARAGLPAGEAEAAVAATDGWVTGVLFRSHASGEPVTGLGGESEPLYEYLSSQILAELPDHDRDFLIATSVLEEVDAGRAAAIGIADGGERLWSLRSVHLPVTWQPTGLRMRCHPCFHEYLQSRLARLDPQTVRDLRLAHARLLVDEGRDEDAVEECIRVGVPEAALEPAMRAIRGIADRLDVQVAERWVRALAPVAPAGASPLVTAQLMVAMARTDVREAVRIADRLAELGDRQRWAQAEPRDAWMMTWGYIHAARFEDVDEILAQVPGGPELEGVRYAMGAMHDPPERDHGEGPALLNHSVDALIFAGSYAHGRLAPLTEQAPSQWLESLERPWRIGALRALGRTREALWQLEQALEAPPVAIPLLAQTGPELLIDAARREAAAAMLEQGRKAAADAGSVVFQSLNRIIEAKLALRLDRDPAAARTALETPECRRGARAMRFVGELWDMWTGWGLLQEERDVEALEHLQRSVAGMRSGNRLLELPTALIYLAEAAARIGDDALADASGDQALAAAAAQGSDHLVLQALSDFPTVGARRREQGPGLEERWEGVLRGLTVQTVSGPAVAHPLVEIVEFGHHGLRIDGAPAKARLAKTYELLSYVMTVPGRCVHRDDLHAVLFGDRRDKSSRAYLRGAIQGLRAVLPSGFVEIRDDGLIAVADGARIQTESIEFESRIAEAARRHGRQRLAETIDALTIYDRGPYLDRVDALWADDRGVRLFGLAIEARHQAALLAFGLGRFEQARELAGRVIADDPGRESAWRLRMRVAAAMGHESEALAMYTGCVGALAALGLEPSGLTTELLARLRR
jgi:DNA-binding SARP family transcriptional activator